MNIEIVIPTKQTDLEYKESKFYKCLHSISEGSEHRVSFSIIGSNTTGLSALFQKHLDDIQEQNIPVDIVTFLHDDLEIHDHFFFDKLVTAHEQFDIVGMAGAVSQDYSPMVFKDSSKEIPLVWHMRKTRPDDGRGFVSHFIPAGDYNSVTHINSAYFGPTPAEVVVIDGLLMSFKVESLPKDEAVFNAKFTFHHYDMAMCANAKNLGLSIGVWPIYGIHYGLGEYANDPTWHEMQDKFKKQYSSYKSKV